MFRNICWRRFPVSLVCLVRDTATSGIYSRKCFSFIFGMVGEVVRDTAESRPGLVLMIQQVPDGGFHGSHYRPHETEFNVSVNISFFSVFWFSWLITFCHLFGEVGISRLCLAFLYLGFYLLPLLIGTFLKSYGYLSLLSFTYVIRKNYSLIFVRRKRLISKLLQEFIFVFIL